MSKRVTTTLIHVYRDCAPMQSRVALILIALSLATAGCIGGVQDDLDEQNVAQVPDLLDAADTPLWSNPQTQPHPDFGFPTLTNPPQGEDIPTWWQPIEPRALPAEITGVEHLATDGDQVKSGAGIAIFGSLAVVPAWNDDTAVFDISDPQDPQKLSTIKTVARDADTIAYPDGRLVVVFATDNGVSPVWDITDPTDPQHLVDLEPEDGSHNVAVVPGTPILYNANSAGGQTDDARMSPDNGEGITEIYDLSDPANPKLVQNWENGYGCHDISFYIAQDKQRAYCAGIEYTQIWDISDAENPEVITSIPVHYGMTGETSLQVPLLRFSHLAMVNADASVLIVGDETGGGAAPACDAHAQAAGVSESGPLGNLYFYDLSDEENPEYMGQFSPTHHYPTNPPTGDEGGFGAAGCTAHFGRIIPTDGDQDLMAMAWYGAGVTLIDFTDPENPMLVDQWNENTNTWDVWYYNGYLFTGDMSYGMDILTLV